MSVEAKRGCGFRKVGGTYMVSGKLLSPCDRLPFKLSVCPCCGEGYRPSRNLRRVNPSLMFKGSHVPCQCRTTCFVCNPPATDKTGHYLEWVGGSFYKTPEDFTKEAKRLGISRRLKTGIPRDLVVGESIIFLAHRNVVTSNNVKKTKGSEGGFTVTEPAIFSAFVVSALEHICTESELTKVNNCISKGTKPRAKRIKQLFRMQSNGVKLVAVPDNDKDHR